jgi:hypothetical protein
MGSFLDRYCRGERQQVWDELVHLGKQVRTEALIAEARAVAQETMRRAKENVIRLVARLDDIGYEFAYQHDLSQRIGCWWGDSFPVYDPPFPDVAGRLDELEQTIGPMPLSLRAWYEVAGTVNLIGRHDDWPDIEVVDPLVVCPLSDMLASIEDQYRDWQEWQGDDVEDADPFRWDIAPDDLHKANISGGPPYGVEYPSADADTRLCYEWHNTTFVKYLRTCFRWGGFPGFERVPESERPSDHLALLTEGLLPL